jgi:threonine/homoserine/homoserine lactone efflux protein
MSEHSLLAFAVTSAIIEVTPGPNMAYLAVLALSAGRQAGLVAVAGIAVGLLCIGAAASAGLAAVLSNSPVAYEGLRWGGAIYLLWLAWEGWRDPPQDGVDSAEPHTLTQFFVRGLITNLLNPKAAIFYVAVLPSFIDDQQPLTGQTATLLAIYVAIATVVHIVVVMLADWVGASTIQNSHRATFVRKVLAILLALIAVWLFVSAK